MTSPRSGDAPRPFRPDFTPRRVLLFSGHMVDAPGRPQPRFPPAKVAAAEERIDAALAAVGAGAGDFALTQGAAGGDIIFAEACLARRVRVQLLLPLAMEEFVVGSILSVLDGDAWLARFQALERRLQDAPREAPIELGPLAGGDDAFVRGNLWLLESALAAGADVPCFICLWDGGGGDGPGGTRHMVEEVERRGGQVTWVDTRKL